jgi:hypothetical protein
MTLYIPADITNIILEYYAQLNDLLWAPFVDVKTGELKRRLNKYSTKYDNINKLIEYRQNNLINDINIDVIVHNNGEETDFYNTVGTCIYTKIKVCKFNMIIPISNLYIEFTDEYNFKYSVFCSTYGSSLRRIDNNDISYDVYQDSNLHSTLTSMRIFDKTTFTLVLEKF